MTPNPTRELINSVGDGESNEGPRGLRVCDNCRRKKSKCNMARPKCQACIARHFSCTYTTLKRKPGPQKGSTSVRERKIQAQLDRFEQMLQERQHKGLAFSAEYVGSLQNANSVPLDYDLTTLTMEASAMGSRNWMNNIPNDQSKIDTRLKSVHGHKPPVQHEVCLDLHRSGLGIGSMEGAAGLWETNSQDSRVRAGSSNGSQCDIAIPCKVSHSNIAMGVDQPPSTGLTLPLPADVEMHLISLYFTYLQPIYPIFQRATFYDDYKQGKVPLAVLYAVFALSARHSSDQLILNQSQGGPCHAGEVFICRARTANASNENANGPITLDDLKAAFLSCVYEYTSNPGRRAWVSAGNIVRMAYELGLHQIDAPRTGSQGALSELEKEERRHLWWCVWKLDSWVGISGATPFVVDVQVVCTAFTSSTPADLADGLARPSSQMFLNTDVDKAWGLMRELQTSNDARGYNMFIVVNALMREVATISALRYHHPSKEMEDRHLIVVNSLAAVRLGLPPWFSQTVRNTTRAETVVEHQKRLEVLIQFHICRLLLEYPHCPPRSPSAMPLDNEAIRAIRLQWRTCASHAENVVAVLRDWDPDYFRTVNPEMSCSIWVAGMVLVVHAIIGEDIDSRYRSTLPSSLDVLTLSLEQFSQWWQFCHSMLDSLNGLRKQAFSTHDFNDIYQLLSVLQTPFNPRHTKFLNLSDYQISRSQHEFTHTPDQSSQALPVPDVPSCSSDVILNDATWQEMFSLEDNLPAKEQF